MLFERTDHIKYICTVLLQTKKKWSLIPFERTGIVLSFTNPKKHTSMLMRNHLRFFVFKNGKKKPHSWKQVCQLHLPSNLF